MPLAWYGVKVSCCSTGAPRWAKPSGAADRMAIRKLARMRIICGPRANFADPEILPTHRRSWPARELLRIECISYRTVKADWLVRILSAVVQQRQCIHNVCAERALPSEVGRCLLFQQYCTRLQR